MLCTSQGTRALRERCLPLLWELAGGFLDPTRARLCRNRSVRCRLEADMGIRARFVVGHWPGDPDLERAADDEEAQTSDILRLPVAETYQNLPMKVRRRLRWRTRGCAWQPAVARTFCSMI